MSSCYRCIKRAVIDRSSLKQVINVLGEVYVANPNLAPELLNRLTNATFILQIAADSIEQKIELA